MLIGPHLTNDLSIIVSSKEQLLKEIETEYKKQNNSWKATISNLDSIDKITKLAKINFHSQSKYKLNILYYRLRYVNYFFLDVLKKILNYNKQKVLNSNEIKKLFKLSSDYYKLNLKIDYINSNLIIINKK